MTLKLIIPLTWIVSQFDTWSGHWLRYILGRDSYLVASLLSWFFDSGLSFYIGIDLWNFILDIGNLLFLLRCWEVRSGNWILLLLKIQLLNRFLLNLRMIWSLKLSHSLYLSWSIWTCQWLISWVELVSWQIISWKGWGLPLFNWRISINLGWLRLGLDVLSLLDGMIWSRLPGHYWRYRSSH